MKKNLFLVWALALTIGVTGMANAASFNIDFGKYGIIPSSYGAASGQTGYWNEIDFLTESNSLLDTSGTPTSVDIDITAITDGGYGDSGVSTDASLLLEDNFYDPTSYFVQLTGISNGLYEIYLYAPVNDGVSSGNMLANGISVPELIGSTTAAMIEGVSYTSVQATVSGNTLSISGTDVGAIKTLVGLSGMQVAPATVPIPGAVWLLGSGLVGLVGLRRKFKK